MIYILYRGNLPSGYNVIITFEDNNEFCSGTHKNPAGASVSYKIILIKLKNGQNWVVKEMKSAHVTPCIIDRTNKSSQRRI